MADTWVQIGPSFNVEQPTALAGTVSDALSTVSSLSGLLSSAVELLSSILIDDVNAFRTTVNATVATVETAVLDLLQNNAALAVHVNTAYDPTWHFSQFQEDSTLPWVGNGLSGWLRDLLASTKDSSDPFRPLADAGTSVGGIIILKGAPINQDLGQQLAGLLNLFDAFTDGSDFSEILNASQILREADARKRDLFRLGPAGFSTFVEEVTDIPDEVFAGFEDLSSNPFRRGGSPKWASLPVAALLPAAGELLNLLRQVSESIRIESEQSLALSRLADLLSQRAELLAQAAVTLDNILQTLLSAISFFTDSYIAFVESAPGGFESFAQRAQAANNVPDFGTRGIVAGVAIVGTSDRVLDNIQALFEFLGLEFGQLVEGQTTRAENLEAAFQEFFSP